MVLKIYNDFAHQRQVNFTIFTIWPDLNSGGLSLLPRQQQLSPVNSCSLSDLIIEPCNKLHEYLSPKHNFSYIGFACRAETVDRSLVLL